jgi:hypothetical protein
MAYGREEFTHASPPHKDFYRADWAAATEPDAATAFTFAWAPLVNVTLIASVVFFGAFPTIGKCVDQKSKSRYWYETPTLQTWAI